MFIKSIEKTGEITIRLLESCGRLLIFFTTGAIHIFILPVQFAKIIDHTWFIGVKSFFVIVLTGIFTGMVLGLQGYYSLVKFGSEAGLGAAVALTLVRELGPVLTAIMVTARAGSAMAAEIGVMRISEQIDALKTMHINPVRFLFTPRLIASVISFPLLTSLVFSLIVTTLCCYRGYYTHLFSGFGARSVSLSTTNAVVQSCIFILISDYIITYFLV